MTLSGRRPAQGRGRGQYLVCLAPARSPGLRGRQPRDSQKIARSPHLLILSSHHPGRPRRKHDHWSD